MPRFEVIFSDEVRAELARLAPDLSKVERDEIGRMTRNLADDPYMDVMKGRTSITSNGRTLLIQVLIFMRTAITFTYHIVDNTTVDVIACRRELLGPAQGRM